MIRDVEMDFLTDMESHEKKRLRSKCSSMQAFRREKGEVCQEVQQKRRGSHRSWESHRDFSEVGNPAKTRTDSTQNSNFNVCNA
jgi:hypothetical protein